MTDITGNVTALRPLSDSEALDWLRSQPGGRISAKPGALGRRWNWHHRKVSGRLSVWSRQGLITKRRNSIAVVDITTTPRRVAEPQPVGKSPVSTCPATGRVTVSNAHSKPASETGFNPASVVVFDAPKVAVRHGNLPSSIVIASYVAAFGLSAVSAGFSITGMTSIFVGATVPVVAMGIALELGKLSAVSWLGHHGGTSWRLRAALTVLVVVLMALNALGAFGYLSKAHIGHVIEGDVAAAGKVADVDARISVQAGLVSDLDRRIAQIDGAVSEATRRGRTGSAMRLADDQRRIRSDLSTQHVVAAKTLAALQVEKAGIEGQRRVAEADLGPVRYLATLLGAGDQDVLRWFILVVALLLDPAAVLLLLAATSARR
jgi:hypothetical protein